MRYLILVLLVTGCASGPSVKNQSDIAQMADAATTFTALELFSGFAEGNPIIEPLTGSPAGYATIVAVKLSINYGFRRAKPRTCVQGVRALTSLGYAAALSNGLLIAGTGPVGLVVGLGIGIWNYLKNNNFIDECRLREQYPDHDIDEAWKRGLLFTEEGVRKPEYFLTDQRR